MASGKPTLRLSDGFCRSFLQNPRRAVAIHVDLSHIACHTRFFQLLHQDKGGVGVERGEHAHAGRAVGDQLMGEAGIDLAGIGGVGKTCLGGEGVGAEPVQQGQIHAHAQHGILGCVEVHIGKGLHNELVAVVVEDAVTMGGGQLVIDALNDAVTQHHIAVFHDVQFAQSRRMNDVTFQNLFHCLSPHFSAKSAAK